MTNAMMERDRVRAYTRGEMLEVIDREKLVSSDATYIAAIFIDPQVISVSGEGHAMNLPTKSIPVYEVVDGDTGYTLVNGKGRVAFINEGDILDYELISELHQQKDAHAYIWTTVPYEKGGDYELLNVWYRDETYPDTYKEDTR